ncbi:granzyme M-like [Hoplias malabaricus]|uniref:granzyme M-like n=1 Tax=Hoplias malabaricus TaxID=27720 RepID=UPI003462736A
MALLSLLLLAALLQNLSHSARVNVGIVNGKEVVPHSRPYMVSVQEYRRHICGGFFVSNKYVMTSAHCYDRKQSIRVLTVVVGAHDLLNSREGSRMNVQSCHVYPNFNAQTLDNDIMLIKLRGTVIQSQTVNWIPIPLTTEEGIPVNMGCSVVGWGKTGQNNPPSARLLETQTQIIDRTMCINNWHRRPITQSMVCARGPATCKFDSGGPLVCGGTAVGIVSFGEVPCDYSRKPNVYAKISAFLPWIRSFI